MAQSAGEGGAAAAGRVWVDAHGSMRAGIRARLLFTRLLGVAIAVVVLSSASRWSTQGPSSIAQAFFAAGALLAVGGFGGRLWALCHIAGRKKRQLVRSGPYAVCRHPLYLCSLVGGLGLVLCTARLSVVALYLVACAVLVPLAIRCEEAFLEERFPDYAAYRAAVPALLPQWWRIGGWGANRCACASLETDVHGADPPVEVDPRAVRRGLFESIAFLSPLLLFELVERAQQAGMLPVLFILP